MTIKIINDDAYSIKFRVDETDGLHDPGELEATVAATSDDYFVHVRTLMCSVNIAALDLDGAEEFALMLLNTVRMAREIRDPNHPRKSFQDDGEGNPWR